MQSKPTFQIHANVNSSHGDSALRVTISFYDENGDLVQHKTWRKHVSNMWVEGLEWQALVGLTDLHKMMQDVCGTTVGLDDIDTPLF